MHSHREGYEVATIKKGQILVFVVVWQLLRASISTTHLRKEYKIYDLVSCLDIPVLWFFSTHCVTKMSALVLYFILQKRLPGCTGLRSFTILTEKQLIQQEAQLKAC